MLRSGFHCCKVLGQSLPFVSHPFNMSSGTPLSRRTEEGEDEDLTFVLYFADEAWK